MFMWSKKNVDNFQMAQLTGIERWDQTNEQKETNEKTKKISDLTLPNCSKKKPLLLVSKQSNSTHINKQSARLSRERRKNNNTVSTKGKIKKKHTHTYI